VQLQGVYPPIATPFTTTGDLDLDALGDNIARWAATRLRGLVVLGSNGEAPYIDDDEAETLIAAVRGQLPPEKLVIAGTGRESTRATLRATERAARAGADAVLVRVPGFFKAQMTSEALVRHYLAVADRSPVPVLLYNFAAAFGVNLGIEAIAGLATHPNIVGLKESGGDVAQIADQVNATPRDFAIVVGGAPTLYASLCAGAVGGVVAVANVVPDACLRLFDLTLGGRHDEARALQRALTPLARAVTTTYGVAGLKAAMDVAGYRGGPPRAPLVGVPPHVIGELDRLLHELRTFLEGSHAFAS
jgi:4-hydroxy-2-oxoglutarate aldolase